MIEGYFERVRQCRTENQINALHIALENHLCPAEFEALRADARFPALAPAIRARIERYAGGDPDRAEPALRWRREAVHPQISLYSDGAPVGAKPLLVGFACGGGRLLMPIPPFLHELDATRCDFLIVRDPTKRAYLRGVDGVADDFAGLLGWLDDWAGRRGYRRRIAFGTSYGGLPALCAAATLGFERGVSIGGATVDYTSSRDADLGIRYTEFAPWLARHRPERTELVYAFGAGFASDALKGAFHRKVGPIRLLAIPSVTAHNVPWVLWRSRRLSDLLRCLLAESADIAARFPTLGPWPADAVSDDGDAPRQAGWRTSAQAAFDRVRDAIDHRRAAVLLAGSGLFDGDWYLRRYRDAAAGGWDPVEHYLRLGAGQCRDPGPDFDTGWYFARYPDIHAKGMNPLVHFLRFGEREGRERVPALPDHAFSAPSAAL